MNVKGLRMEKNLTQQEFADSIGVTKQAISQIELGKNEISVKLAKIIGNVYSVKWYLFFEDDVK